MTSGQGRPDIYALIKRQVSAVENSVYENIIVELTIVKNVKVTE